MSYVIYKTDGSLFLTLADGQVDTSNTSLALLGKNIINYGQYQNSNLVHSLENFANTSPPPNPLQGQTWFDNTTGVLRLKLFNGTAWNSLPNIAYSDTTPTLNEGDFWWKPTDKELYIQTDTSPVLIGGPNTTAFAAAKLSTARTINGVEFNGTANITISSTLTNVLTFGSYLVGDTFDGSSALTIDVDVGASNAPTPSKVVARNSDGDIWFRVGNGVATASQYADLAEKYLTDNEYDVGTVIAVGGTAEVTQSSYGDRAIGVISANPGFMMNKDLAGGQYVALKGRVPVKVSGSVTKKQRLVAGDNGFAIGVTDSDPNVFAIALEDSNGKDIIEAVIL